MRQLLAFLFCFALTLPTISAQEKIRGDYNVLGDLPKKNSLEKVIFEGFINFGCLDCNNFRLLSKGMKEKYKDRVDFRYIPILFRGQADAPLRLYYVAKSLGKGEEVNDALYEARFVNGVNVFDPGIVNYLARSLGIGAEYKRDAQKPEITQLIQKGEVKSALYGVSGTPTIVLAGVLKMKNESSMENFVEVLPDTLDDLLK